MAGCERTTQAGALALIRLYFNEEANDQCLEEYCADFEDDQSVSETRSWTVPSLILMAIGEYLEGQQAAWLNAAD